MVKETFLPFFRHQCTPSTRASTDTAQAMILAGAHQPAQHPFLRLPSTHTWLPLLSLLLHASEGQGQQPGCDLYRDYFARGSQAQGACGGKYLLYGLCTTLYKVVGQPSFSFSSLRASRNLSHFPMAGKTGQEVPYWSACPSYTEFKSAKCS